MDRFVEIIRHYVNTATNFAGLLFPLNPRRLLWGFGAIAVLVPATAYAWWHQNSTPVSQAVNEQSPRNTTQYIKQSVPSEVNASLNAETNSSNTSSVGEGSAKAGSDNNANVQLHINGQAVPVPPQGTVHKEFSSQNGKTSVDFSVNSATSGTSQSHTSMDIELNSSAKSESGGGD